MLPDLQGLFLAEKTIARMPDWVERNSEQLALVCPLDVAGVTIEGLQFRATAFRCLPDRALSIQLEYHAPRGTGGPICRVEWRPIKAHNNKGMGPPEYRHVLITGSHLHGFDLNWAEAAKFVRRGNLPVAVPILPQPATFAEALAFAAKEFRIKNLEKAPLPPWQQQMVLG